LNEFCALRIKHDELLGERQPRIDKRIHVNQLKNNTIFKFIETGTVPACK
jgi:hypothetical protein